MIGEGDINCQSNQQESRRLRWRAIKDIIFYLDRSPRLSQIDVHFVSGAPQPWSVSLQSSSQSLNLLSIYKQHPYHRRFPNEFQVSQSRLIVTPYSYTTYREPLRQSNKREPRHHPRISYTDRSQLHTRNQLSPYPHLPTQVNGPRTCNQKQVSRLSYQSKEAVRDL